MLDQLGPQFGSARKEGKVGTGWYRRVSSEIRKQPNDVVTPKIETDEADQEI